jgi:NAD(P)H-dependent flavin oxidoreductase YrpB (nitropropane dioxygenase family)
MYLIIDKEKIFNDILNYHKKINNKKGLFYINGYTTYKNYVNEMVTKMKILYEKEEKNEMIKTLNIMKMMQLMEELSDKVKYEIKDNKICFVRDAIKFYDFGA